jgi:7,8-dihydropterin-6-yl-methyl-4-(beta-D-ribofuranosyl)aminobenzene 5'-phosphate synthase
VDLRSIDAIILSHGHNDHTGGLAAVLARIGRGIRVIAHQATLEPKYGRRAGTEHHRYNGMPHRREALEAAGARFELTASPTWLTDDIVASGEEPITTDFEAVTPTAFVKRGDRFEPDPMADDQSLYVRTDRGLVVLLGCAHRGMVNIILHARTLMQTREVYLVVGGTHLGFAPEEQVTPTIAALKEMQVQWLGLSHCTGLSLAGRLSDAFGDRFFPNNAGAVITLPLDP